MGNTVSLSIQILIMLLIGVYAERRHIVREDFDQQISTFILQIALPLMIVHSMQLDFTVDRLKQCGQLLALSCLMAAVTFVIGQALFLLLGKGAAGRVARFGTVFMNFTVVGIPVIEMLYGESSLFAFIVFTIPLRLLYYSTPQALLSPQGGARQGGLRPLLLRALASPPFIAILCGALLFVLNIRLPAALDSAMKSVGSVCSPLGMVMCGLCIGKYELKNILQRNAFLLTAVRNMLCPAVTLLLCRLLAVPQETAQIAVICASLPVGVIMAAFVVRYDGSDAAKCESAGGIAVSSVLSSVTIPFWAYVLTRIY